MNAPTSPASDVDPRDQRVFDAVRELLSIDGMRLSMEAVAARAGCSKQTLYSRYGCKQDLLRRVLQQYVVATTAQLALEDDDDVRQTLEAFAVTYLESRSLPQAMQTHQLLLAEARSFPEEAEALYRNSAVALHSHLAEWMATASRRGNLRHDDPHFMAELLISMIAGLDFDRRLFNAPYRDGAEARRHWAGFAVDAFLRAMAPEAEQNIFPHTNKNKLRSYS